MAPIMVCISALTFLVAWLRAHQQRVWASASADVEQRDAPRDPLGRVVWSDPRTPA